jgi:7-keto-8-aminopelargonate synthetase-like enzyme
LRAEIGAVDYEELFGSASPRFETKAASASSPISSGSPKAFRAPSSIAIGAEITVWCSNDCLGMGQSPLVLAVIHEALGRAGCGAHGAGSCRTTDRHSMIGESTYYDMS